MIRLSRTALACSLLLASLASLSGCTMKQLPVTATRLDGYTAMQANNSDKAYADFVSCVQRDPTDYKSHYYLGLIELDRHDLALARRHFELANTLLASRRRRPLVLEPGAPDTAVPAPTRGQITDALAETLLQMNLQQQLVAFLRDTVAQYGTTDDYLRLARYLVKIKDYDSAREAFLNAAKVADAFDARPYMQLADFYDGIGDRDAALTQLRIAYGINPNADGLADNIRSHGLVPGPTVTLPRPTPEQLAQQMTAVPQPAPPPAPKPAPAPAPQPPAPVDR